MIRQFQDITQGLEKQAWLKCKRADWLIWFAGKHKMVTHQEIVLVACTCAETALKYIPKGEDRPRQAIEAARRWALNPTEKNRKAAHLAAHAAHLAAFAVAKATYEAADAAAFAAYAAANAADETFAAYAADEAANATAYAAYESDESYATRSATARTAHTAAQKKLCRIVRKIIKFKEV